MLVHLEVLDILLEPSHLCRSIRRHYDLLDPLLQALILHTHFNHFHLTLVEESALLRHLVRERFIVFVLALPLSHIPLEIGDLLTEVGLLGRLEGVLLF